MSFARAGRAVTGQQPLNRPRSTDRSGPSVGRRYTRHATELEHRITCVKNGFDKKNNPRVDRIFLYARFDDGREPVAAPAFFPRAGSLRAYMH